MTDMQRFYLEKYSVSKLKLIYDKFKEPFFLVRGAFHSCKPFLSNGCSSL